MKVLWLVFLYLLCPSAGAQPEHSPGNLIPAAPTVATFLDFPPYISDSQPADGVLSVIVKESFERAGITPSYTLVPWRRSYRAVSIGEIEASYSWAYSKERENEFHLSLPVFSISNQLLTTYEDIENWEQLAEPRADGTKPILCVPVGWKVADELIALIDQGLLQRVSPGHPRFCMELIRAERTNIVYMPRMTAIHYLNALKAAEAGEQQRPWPPVYSIQVPSGIANTQHVLFTRNAEGEALKNTFNKGFRNLVTSGRYREILQKYLAGYPDNEQDAVLQEQINAGILPPE